MATILAFSGSNSSTSVNYRLVRHTALLLSKHKVHTMNMHHLSFPMYSEDQEREKGFSNSLVELRDEIQSSDGLIISVNEHNGNPSAYFKNLIDWLSRLERKFLDGKKILLMSASPGKRGGIGALEAVANILPRFGGEIVTTFSLPSFHTNFKDGEGILDTELATAHRKSLDAFINNL